MFCIYCGSALPEDAAFCPVCGKKVMGKAEPESLRMYPGKCTSCGGTVLKKIRAGEYQCEYCGMMLFSDEQNDGEDQEAIDAKVALLLSEASAYAKKKDYQNELLTLVKAYSLAPEDDCVLLRLGRAHWRLGSFDKAMEYYRIAEKLYPDDPTVYTNIGTVFFKQGHNEKAKTEYEKALAIIEADSTSVCAEDRSIAYGNYAYCLGRLGDIKNAKKYLSIAKDYGYPKESIDIICMELHLIPFLI